MIDALWQGRSERPRCFVFPTLDGTIFNEILGGSGAVAVGRWHTTNPRGPYKIQVLGQLSLPVGRRPLIALGEDLDDSTTVFLIQQNVRYVILDDTAIVPKSLEQAAQRIDHPPGFIVVVLPANEGHDHR